MTMLAICLVNYLYIMHWSAHSLNLVGTYTVENCPAPVRKKMRGIEKEGGQPSCRQVSARNLMVRKSRRCQSIDNDIPRAY